MSSPRQAVDRDTRRDVIRLWGPLGLLTLAAFVVALYFADAPPPSRVLIGTGPEGGAYAEAGAKFAAALGDAGIDAELVATEGSLDNLELLRSGKVDVALVQGGLARPEEPGLSGIASLYLEPLWVFVRSASLGRLDDLSGRSVDIDDEGSGTRVLAERLLDEAGVEIEVASPGSGDADVIIRVAGARSDVVEELLKSDEFTPISLRRAEGIARSFPYVRHVRIAAGSIDLAEDLPATDVDTVAPAAMLVADDELHPAVVGLLVERAKIDFSSRGVLSEEGEFPTLALLDVAPSSAARAAIEKGPSFLYRVLPFQAAALLDRLKILLLPLVTLLFPLFRLAPPLYRWRIRRRILTWYRQTLDLEKRLREGDASAEELASAVRELDRFDDELAAVEVPLGYADELYNLRLHLRMVREDLEKGRGRWAS